MERSSRSRSRKIRTDKKQEPDCLSSDSNLRENDNLCLGEENNGDLQKSEQAGSLKYTELRQSNIEDQATGSNSPDMKRQRFDQDNPSVEGASSVDTSEFDDFEIEYGAAADEEVEKITKGMEAQTLNDNVDSEEAMLRSDNNHSFVSKNHFFLPDAASVTPLLDQEEADRENGNDYSHIVRPVTTKAPLN